MLKFKSVLALTWLVVIFAGCSPKPVLNQGTGMAPALRDGDRILIDGSFGELKRGDIVTFLYPKDQSKSYIKRVVGLPGETVAIAAGRVYINGQPLDEPYLDEAFNKAKASFGLKTAPENSYFVIGDNRDNSSDSRYWEAVPRDLIKGRYFMTYLKDDERK